MDEILITAREELKRFEHTIHVTLKYTRTIDVLLNALERLVSTYDIIFEALLENAKDNHLIVEIPKSPSLRSSLLIKIYPEDKELLKFITFYTFIRDTSKAKYKKREEYRRHVTLVVDFKNRTAEIDIDNLETCENVSFQFFDYAREIIEGKLEEDD